MSYASSAPAIDSLLTLDCTLLKRTADGAVDEYGNPAYTVVEQATRCELQQAGSREELGGAVQVTTWRVFLPADAPARGWDAIRFADGRVLELEGDAADWKSPVTAAAHVEAYLRRVE